jgi:hypothetical protein
LPVSEEKIEGDSQDGIKSWSEDGADDFIEVSFGRTDSTLNCGIYGDDGEVGQVSFDCIQAGRSFNSLSVNKERG